LELDVRAVALGVLLLLELAALLFELDLLLALDLPVFVLELVKVGGAGHPGDP
jgi:hypothetical protein